MPKHVQIFASQIFVRGWSNRRGCCVASSFHENFKCKGDSAHVEDSSGKLSSWWKGQGDVSVCVDACRANEACYAVSYKKNRGICNFIGIQQQQKGMAPHSGFDCYVGLGDDSTGTETTDDEDIFAAPETYIEEACTTNGGTIIGSGTVNDVAATNNGQPRVVQTDIVKWSGAGVGGHWQCQIANDGAAASRLVDDLQEYIIELTKIQLSQQRKNGPG